MGGAPCGAGEETDGIRCKRAEGVGRTGSEASATMGGMAHAAGEILCLIIKVCGVVRGSVRGSVRDTLGLSSEEADARWADGRASESGE